MKRTGTLPVMGLMLLLSGFALTSVQAETIYKWTDAQGTVHFGERPPEGVKAEIVSVTTGSSTSADSQDDPYAAARAKLQTPAEAKQQRAELAQQRELEQQQEARMAAACEAQRARLQELIPRSKVLLQNPDGTSRMLSDDERLSMIDESQKFVDENCN